MKLLQQQVAWSLKFRCLLVFAVLLPLVVAALLALLLPKTYRARVVMVAEIEKSEQEGATASVASGLSTIAARFGIGGVAGATGAEHEAIATLTSRAFIHAFISEKNLLPVLFRDRWDEKSKSWKDAEVPTDGEAYRRFVEDIIEVKKDIRTGLVTLNVEWTDRQLAAEWANELVERINEKMRQRAIKEAGDTLAYLSRELEVSRQLEVKDAIYRVLEWNLTKVAMANVRKEYAFRVIDPAVVPELDEYISPKRLVIVGVGVVLSALMALCLILLQSVLGNSGYSRT